MEINAGEDREVLLIEYLKADQTFSNSETISCKLYFL